MLDDLKYIADVATKVVEAQLREGQVNIDKKTCLAQDAVISDVIEASLGHLNDKDYVLLGVVFRNNPFYKEFDRRTLLKDYWKQTLFLYFSTKTFVFGQKTLRRGETLKEQWAREDTLGRPFLSYLQQEHYVDTWKWVEANTINFTAVDALVLGGKSTPQIVSYVFSTWSEV
jgi:hypothetical protein